MRPSEQFDRQITIVKPGPQTLSDDGEMVSSGAPTRYHVWAHWMESPGSERLTGEQELGSDQIVMTIWWNEMWADMDTTWQVESETGVELDVVSVTEFGGRNWMLKIRAQRRV